MKTLKSANNWLKKISIKVDTGFVEFSNPVDELVEDWSNRVPIFTYNLQTLISKKEIDIFKHKIIMLHRELLLFEMIIDIKQALLYPDSKLYIRQEFKETIQVSPKTNDTILDINWKGRIIINKNNTIDTVTLDSRDEFRPYIVPFNT